MADINEQIQGYRLRRLLQTGQVSQVFEVVEPSSNRHFAMKVLLPEHASDKAQREILFHEAEIGVKLRHDNIIKIVKVSKDKATPHFIMEYFPAGSLRSRLLQKDLAFIRTNARKIIKQAATAFAYMHGNGWIHCDVKPDNILVNELVELKLIDFAITKKQPKGLAKLFHRRGKAQGTRSYMSPEQIRDQPLDARADIYSFGATIYELLTGRPPFRGNSEQDLLQKHLAARVDTPKSYNPDITDDMAALILKMLAKKKEDRPPHCHDIFIKLRSTPIFKDEPLHENY